MFTLHLTRQHLPFYLQLIRFDKPIGTLLLLWPTLWGLWIAAEGVPSAVNLLAFSFGVFFMRSAGCVINDFADRNIDGHVKRTEQRPLAQGKVSTQEAWQLFYLCIACAFICVLFTNWLTILLAPVAVLLASAYPFMKRYTYFPQVVLGAAFSWGIIMAFTAETGDVPKEAWLVYIATVVWTVVYDTFYAMVDREDDLKIGVKSTAILFGDFDKLILAFLQLFVSFVLFLIGYQFKLGYAYFFATLITANLFMYQQWLIQERKPEQCFKAFLNNNWVGAVMFVGLVVDFAVR